MPRKLQFIHWLFMGLRVQNEASQLSTIGYGNFTYFNDECALSRLKQSDGFFPSFLFCISFFLPYFFIFLSNIHSFFIFLQSYSATPAQVLPGATCPLCSPLPFGTPLIGYRYTNNFL